MSKQLPSRPSLEQLRKQAKSLLKTWKATEPNRSLSEAQHAVAQEYGFKNWAALKKHLEPNPGVVDLLKAVARGDLKAAGGILDAQPDLLNERGGDGTRTALHVAAISGREDAVRFLLRRGADPNVRCEGDSALPLHFAAEKGRFGIIKALIEGGSDPIGEGDYHELEVIGWATCYGQAWPEIVDYLLQHGARHTIFSAVTVGDIAAIKANGAGKNLRIDLSNQRRRPLHLAVVKKQLGSLRTLLELGADTEGLDEAMLTPLDQAALTGEIEMANTLLDHGAKLRLPGAVGLGRTDDIAALLRKDPDCLRPNGRWGTLIVRAASAEPGHIVEQLIAAGASVNVWDEPKTAVDNTSGFTPLHAAAFFGNEDAARVLLKHGANVRQRDSRWQGPPAGWAQYAGHQAIRELIDAGEIDIFYAIESGMADRIPGILERDPEALNRPFAAYLNGTERVTGTWVEGVKREPEYTPLGFATALGAEEAVWILQDRGARFVA